MEINSIRLYSDGCLAEVPSQSELLSKSEAVLFETEKYHATGSIGADSLSFVLSKKDNCLFIPTLIKESWQIKNLYYPFQNSEFHVYFIDTDYPILYKQTNSTLHFFCPGSAANYSYQELKENNEVFSRVAMNYFGHLLSHDKPLHEIFRNFQFNGIDCDSIKNVQMNGSSLGGGMQHFLLVYILQNIHMFNSLRYITLNMIAPCCFHHKISQSLNKQFNDVLSQVNWQLKIIVNYTIHLKDPVPRAGNPFILQYMSESNSHDVIYDIEIYAYCCDEECCHRVGDSLSHKYQCDIVPDGSQSAQYHAPVSHMRQYPHYKKFQTSDFQKLQYLIDQHFSKQHIRFREFESFFVSTYGDDYLQDKDVHATIRSHENLAYAILRKYESEHDPDYNNNYRIENLRKMMKTLEKLEGVRKLQDLAQKGHLASKEQAKWNPLYLNLCGLKSQIAKLTLPKVI